MSELKDLICPENEDFVVHLKNISEVHRVPTRKEMDIVEAKEVLTNFTEHWNILRDKDFR